LKLLSFFEHLALRSCSRENKDESHPSKISCLMVHKKAFRAFVSSYHSNLSLNNQQQQPN